MMTIDTDILIVAATLVGLFALSSCVSAWVERRWPLGAVLVLALALGVLGFVHLSLREDGLTLRAIPEAFIHVAAMVL